MSRSPAQLFCQLVGAVLVVTGLVGFVVSADFSVGSGVEAGKGTLLLFDVNGWHNLVHVLTGGVALAVSRSASAARVYALALGAVYLVVTILGFAAGTPLLGLIPINGPDNLLHLALAAAGLAAGLASPRVRPATA
jgi:hypothetical protein